MEGNEMMRGFTPFESFMVAEKTSKKASGTAIAGLVLGTVGAAAAIGAWVFGPVVSSQRAKGIEKLVDVTNANTNNTLNRLATLLDQERGERVAQGLTISQSITDSISGTQSSQLSAQQAAELSSIQSVQQNLLNQAVLGNLSENPQKVQIYSAPQPCGCPGSCNG